MSIFEFNTVLLSIVVGLGLTEILSGLARAIHARRVTWDSWLPLTLAAVVFLTQIQVWWYVWTLRDVQEWSLHQLIHLMVNPGLLYLLSHLLFSPEPTISLREHYFQRHRLLFSVVALSSLVGITYRSIAFGESIFQTGNLAGFATLLGATALAATPKAWLHGLLVPAGAALALLDLVVGMYTISPTTPT